MQAWFSWWHPQLFPWTPRIFWISCLLSLLYTCAGLVWGLRPASNVIQRPVTEVLPTGADVPASFWILLNWKLDLLYFKVCCQEHFTPLDDELERSHSAEVLPTGSDVSVSFWILMNWKIDPHPPSPWSRRHAALPSDFPALPCWRDEPHPLLATLQLLQDSQGLPASDALAVASYCYQPVQETLRVLNVVIKSTLVIFCNQIMYDAANRYWHQ